MIKAVVFDLDDTLTKTSETKYDALKFAASNFYKLELTTEIIRSHWGKPYKQFMKDLFGEVDTIDSIIDNYYSIRGQFPSAAHENAVQVVQELSRSYFLGLVTATAKNLAEDDLIAAGFDITLFDYVQTSEQTSVHKPNPKVFEPISKILKKKNILPSEVVYIGDSLSDYEAAKGNGFHFVGMSGRTTSHEKFHKISFATDHFSKLPKIIKSIR